MAFTKNTATKAKEPKSGKDEKKKEDAPPHDSVRETIESVVIAFVLAFLFRTFEAEAFVIPTGSMAPTLMGQHKDIECAACKYPYRVSASSEEKRPREIVKSSVCPNCGYRMPVDDQISYAGDRLLVAKFSYELAEPQRWDVVVFKFPGGAKNNYIKRLIGLPNETITIQDGDIFTSPNPPQPDSNPKIERKPPDKVRAMLQTVYDNDFVMADWIKAKWPACWYAIDEARDGAWTMSDDCKSFSTKGSADQPAWLRYRRIVPSAASWKNFTKGRLTEDDLQSAQPTLVADAYGYNTGSSDPADWVNSPSLGRNWVGDLALECELDISGSNGLVILELIKGGKRFECRLDLNKASASLAIPTLESFAPHAENVPLGQGKHKVMFANVDEQLLLWIDDNLVSFNASTSYPPLHNNDSEDADKSPVGIGVQGSAATVNHLRVLRDVYYIAASREQSSGGAIFEIPHAKQQFALKEDQFFMLGDNSPASSDSRLWDSFDHQAHPEIDVVRNRTFVNENPEYWVRRDLLIGKAIYIYWPHAWAPDWAWPVRIYDFQLYLPFYPNFWRMGLVR